MPFRVMSRRKWDACAWWAVVWAGVSACSAPQSSGAVQSEQSMSLAEYDLARDLWLTRGQPREALGHVLKAVELDEENADAAHLAALIYLDFCRRGTDVEDCRLDQAEKQVRHALAVKADFREARNTLGVILIHQKRYADAVRELTPLTTDILYRTPENAWGNIGWAYLEQGALPEARQALSRSIAAQPDFCVGYYRLGLTEERSGRAKEAIEAYTQALNAADGRCTGLQEAYAGRARLLSKLNRVDEAQRDLATCVRLDQRTDAGRECLGLQDHKQPPVIPENAIPKTTTPETANPEKASPPAATP